MIISASRRTDIPAFYSDWLMRRLRSGTCTVANPFNPRQVSRVSLRVEDVDALVFWTRDPRPLMPHLSELDRRGYRYYFLFTLLAYPREFEPATPSTETALEAFHDLADLLGPERVVWRYDPMVLSNVTDAAYHERAFARLAESLKGVTRRCVVSLMDPYRKVRRRMGALAGDGVVWREWDVDTLAPLARRMAACAAGHGIELVSCAERHDLQPYGIPPGKCVDDALMAHVLGVRVAPAKDRAQRKACRCVKSRDIGAYETCTFGCRYCYAVTDMGRARANRAAHDPTAESLWSGHRT